MKTIEFIKSILRNAPEADNKQEAILLGLFNRILSDDGLDVSDLRTAESLRPGQRAVVVDSTYTKSLFYALKLEDGLVNLNENWLLTDLENYKVVSICE